LPFLGYFFNEPTKSSLIGEKSPNLVTLVSISPIFYEQLFGKEVFCAAFMCLQLGFVIFWRKDFGAKAAHKMLVKLTPGR
jgi:hypothetical protein